MRLGVMQPYFFPYLGYFQLLQAVDRFVLYDDVAFIKQGWVNRNRILINDEPSYFTVPLKGASSFRPICKIEIDDGPQNRQWAARLRKTIDNAYRRAPQFHGVFPMIEAVLASGATRIADLACESLRQVAAYLDVDTPCVRASVAYGGDELTGQERVLAICRAERADEYLNPIGGVALYSRDVFAASGVTLRFLKSQPVEYQQFGAPFAPWLSIIDVLMFNPRDAVRELLDRYELA